MFLKYRRAPLVAGLSLLTAIAAALLLVGAFAPPSLPTGFSSLRQLIGINVLLILLPPYMITSWGYAEQRSAMLLGRVDDLLPQPEFAIRTQPPLSRLVLGAALGAVYAMAFNLPIGSLGEFLAGGPLTMVLMGDLLLVVGALVLSTVQSIDATFRAGNYLYALLVAVPAGLVLLLLPMASLHNRLRALRQQELRELDGLIGAAPKTLDDESIEGLERLLQRRERARQAYTWPVNVAMVSRILFYGVIPPAAWIAAALVERLVEAAIAQ
ncbi:MAG: hypothetical protein RIC56_15380 [Pseudomonadales bacterium]